MTQTVFTYDWTIEEDDDQDGNIIRIWGLDQNNKSVCLIVDDFKPYVYMELPNDITWTPEKIVRVKNKIYEILYNSKTPISCELVYMKKLYYI